MPKNANRVSMSMRLPAEFLEMLKVHADLDRRSVTDLIITVMELWFDGRTYTPARRPPKIKAAVKLPAEPKEFIKTFGRQRVANQANREPWLLEAISEAISRITPAPAVLTTEDVSGYATGKTLSDHVVGFDKAIENQLLILGWTQWVQRNDGSPDRLVWRSNA